MTVSIAGLATALPNVTVEQDVVLDWARRMMGHQVGRFERFAAAFENAGIRTRYAVAEPDWFETPRSWQERNELYISAATALFVQAAEESLLAAGWDPEAVDVVVTISSTGIATPTLEARAFSKIGLREDILRVPVFGLGCAGGVSGLSIARDLAAAERGRRVLLVAVEACTLQYRSQEPRKADVIAAALFGDGAAAACLTSDKAERSGHVYSVGKGVQRIWPDTLPIMGWDMGKNSLDVVFDKSIPAFVGEEFQPALEDALAAIGRDLEQFERVVCHPGGTKVLQAIEQCLSLRPGTLDIERDVLRDYGNMSAPTVLFVLDEVLQRQPQGDLLLSALGPGFTASFIPLDRN